MRPGKVLLHNDEFRLEKAVGSFEGETVRNIWSCWPSRTLNGFVSYDLNEQLSHPHADGLFVAVPYKREELALVATSREELDLMAAYHGVECLFQFWSTVNCTASVLS